MWYGRGGSLACCGFEARAIIGSYSVMILSRADKNGISTHNDLA
jgi:hypothetical protein